MKLSISPALLFVATLALPGCQSSSAPGQDATRFDPPNTEFATRLGIAPPPPVTHDQAMAIAAEAAGGTAVSAGQETENGELLFEVQVETASGRKEVEVRASDGGVVEIEPADND
jgi:uncharacterized membrane protein YkoI